MPGGDAPGTASTRLQPAGEGSGFGAVSGVCLGCFQGAVLTHLHPLEPFTSRNLGFTMNAKAAVSVHLRLTSHDFKP